jgi:hypothetical protein
MNRRRSVTLPVSVGLIHIPTQHLFDSPSLPLVRKEAAALESLYQISRILVLIYFTEDCLDIVFTIYNHFTRRCTSVPLYVVKII